jgi:hypothetical protein
MDDAVSYTCSQCGRTEADQDGSVTLFAQKNGWALSRRFEQGKLLLDWYCPSCWQRRSSTSIAIGRKT